MVEAIDDLWPQSSAKGITVGCDGCSDEVLVCGDKGLIEGALIILIGNAVKYSPDGSHIACRVDAVAGQAMCSVADQGPGLSAAQIAGLFEPFQRYDHRVEGAGLGLNLDKTVIKRHGGTIACHSMPGKGARLEIVMPLAVAGD